MQLSDIALMQYLHRKNSLYHGKILELEEAVTNWLSYIPQTFPHYTRHTVEHSKEIVLQISKMLFKDNDYDQASLRLSGIETFIIIAAALLHDSGMVISDQEKLKILQSDSWKTWVSGNGSKRWEEINIIRNKSSLEFTIRNFIADLQTRFLIAEYIRRTHHLRAVEVMTQNHILLGKFSFDDPSLFQTITDVCVAHGLNRYELEDNEKFPERRDIRGEEVNVKFVALLLRIGDLLDMSYDRACPLLMNAACPLPADSLAHWTQYQRITHRLTATDCIEITANCNTQDEHRFLQDWCQWLVDEMKYTSLIMSKATRHSHWIAPSVSIGSSSSSIKILPSSTATYIPSEWKLELDQDMVFQRLISDVYKSEKDFVRELLQNALDATRCKVIVDLKSNGLPIPEYTNEISEDIRERYPLYISLENRAFQSPLSQETHLKQVLIVEDNGLGMDTEVIKRYFLQVGRSYYSSEEFQRNYNFKPNSRFGIGFLSVFAVSEYITVETYKTTSISGEGPISICLTSPKSYLLTDKGTRNKSGTRIEIVLNIEFHYQQLTNLIVEWCKKVEFPIYIKDFEQETIIHQEQSKDLTYEIQSFVENRKFVVSSYPINEKGIFGEVYILHVNENGFEDWGLWNWMQENYEESHPLATRPVPPSNLTCINGIALEERSSSGPFSFRIDYRNEYSKPNLSRQHLNREEHLNNPIIFKRFLEVINQHLSSDDFANKKNKWIYLNKLLKYAPQLFSVFQSDPIIRVFISGIEKLMTPSQLINVDKLYTISANTTNVYSIEQIQTSLKKIKDPVLVDIDFNKIFSTYTLFQNKSVSRIKRIALDDDDFLFLSLWTKDEAIYIQNSLRTRSKASYALTRYEEKHIIGLQLSNISYAFDNKHSFKVLNKENALVKWLIKVKIAMEESSSLPFISSAYNKILELLDTPISIAGHKSEYLNAHLIKWREIEGLPSHLYPPKIKIDKSMFIQKYL